MKTKMQQNEIVFFKYIFSNRKTNLSQQDFGQRETRGFLVTHITSL
jgi:hypothetical protein